ncbi:hypothetical protein ABZ656_31960 [Streptomyces sp. NPDC007095]|uniref:hypothetical protein n=1 Tax=Streptomyces sp. NPDC007095 TaxID=3154482 RepID=UPI0033F20232
MDTTQITPPKPTTSRAILITLLFLVGSNLGFISGIFAGAVGHLSPYAATVAGAGVFGATLAIGLPILIFIIKGDGG